VDADKWFWMVIFGAIAVAALTGCAPGDAGLLGEALADTHRPGFAVPIGSSAPYPWDILPFVILSGESEE
jgi:hypothetical protein